MKMMEKAGCLNAGLREIPDDESATCCETQNRWQCAHNYQFLLRKFFTNKERLSKERRQRPSVLFVAGGPCSGKDTMVRVLQERGIIVPAHSVIISGDVLTDLPAYKHSLVSHPENTPRLRTPYQSIRKLIVQEALESGYQIIITTHLIDVPDYRALVDLIRARGGLSMLVAAATSLDTFSLFADAQEQHTRRTVDREQALELHRNFPLRWLEMIRIVDAHLLIDNSISRLRTNGGPGVSVIGGRSGGTTILDKAVYQAFMSNQFVDRQAHGWNDIQTRDLVRWLDPSQEEPLEANIWSLLEPVNAEETEAASEQEARLMLLRLAEVITSEPCKQLFAALIQRLDTDSSMVK